MQGAGFRIQGAGFRVHGVFESTAGGFSLQKGRLESSNEDEEGLPR